MALTYGDGHYALVRDLVAKRFEKVNEIETRLLIPEELDVPIWSGLWMKPFLWDVVPKDVERIIWFDCDMVAVAPVHDLLPPEDTPFAAVEDYEGSVKVATHDCPIVQNLDRYFNAGFFVMNRECIPVFEKFKEHMPGKGRLVRTYIFHDQTPLNIEIDRAFGERAVSLPCALNWMWASMGYPPDDVRMIHFAGWGGGEARVKFLGEHITRLEARDAGTEMHEQRKKRVQVGQEW